MAIQVRRGLKKDFDPYKMLPGEWAVSIDAQTQNQIVWMCFAAGVVKRMGTYEDFKEQIQEIEGEISNYFYEAFQQYSDTLRDQTEQYIQGKVDDDWIPDLEVFAQRAEKAANAAETSEKNAKISEYKSKEHQESAAGSATTATLKAAQAGQSAEEATRSAKEAGESADVSEDYSKLSESWARGNTGVRVDENTNNSEFFSNLANQLVQQAQLLLEQAERVVAAATEGALIPAGTITFDELPTNPPVGYMYNISNDFTTDSRFEEGAGLFYRAGANVYWTKNGKWDVSVGAQVTGVKGDAESAYHIGNVNITKANIGLGNVPNVTTNNQTPTFTQANIRENIESGNTLSVILGKIMKWFSDLKSAAFCNTANNLTTTTSGTVLDGRMGKTLSDKLGGIEFGFDQDGNAGWKKAGADTVTPFKRGDISDFTFQTAKSPGGWDNLSTSRNCSVTLEAKKKYLVISIAEGGVIDGYNGLTYPGANWRIDGLNIDCKNATIETKIGITMSLAKGILVYRVDEVIVEGEDTTFTASSSVSGSYNPSVQVAIIAICIE